MKAKNRHLPNRLSKRQKDNLHSYLDKIYNNPKVGGGFSSPNKLYKEVKRRGDYANLGLQRIKNYLNSQPSYTLYKPLVRKFPKAPVICTKVKQQLDMDLMDVSRQQSFNSGIRYLVSAIDCLSKIAYLKPIKSKDSKEIVKAVREILDEVGHVDRICTDRGAEFKANQFQNLLKERGIHHFFAGGTGAATIVERFHRTIRGLIARYQYKHNTMTYIDKLSDILKNYNHSYHRSIKMRPIDVNEDNEHIAYENIHGMRDYHTKKSFTFKLGDNVRVAAKKAPWSREFYQRWSEEIFTVSKRYYQQNIAMYKISDCSGDVVIGSYYTEELLKVTHDPKNRYRVEKVIDEAVRNKKRYALVKFVGFPSSCNEWVPKTSIRTIK